MAKFMLLFLGILIAIGFIVSMATQSDREYARAYTIAMQGQARLDTSIAMTNLLFAGLAWVIALMITGFFVVAIIALVKLIPTREKVVYHYITQKEIHYLPASNRWQARMMLGKNNELPLLVDYNSDPGNNNTFGY